MPQQFGKPFAPISRSLTSLCIAAGLAAVAASPSAEAHATKPHPFKSASIAWDPGWDNRASPARLAVAHDGTKYTEVIGLITTRFKLKAKVKSGKRIYGWVVTTGDPELTESLPGEHIGAQNRVREKSLETFAKFAMDAKTALATGTPGISLTAEQDIVDKCNAKFPELPTEEHILDRMDLTVHAGFSAGKRREGFSLHQGGWYNDSSSGRPAIAHTTFPVSIVCLGKPAPRAAPLPPPRAGNTLFSIDLKVSQRGQSCPKDVTVTAYANYRWPAKSRMRMTVDGGFPKIRIADTAKVVFAGKTFHRAEAQFHYKLDPGQRTFKLTVDGAEKTHAETVEIKCPPFKVLSAWLKYDVAQTPVCPKKVVETATFYTTRPGWVNHEIRMEGGLVVSQGKLTSKRVGDKYAAIAVRHLTVGAIDKQFIADVVNDPANSGWVPLKIACPPLEAKVMRDLPSLRPPGAAGTPPAYDARTVVDDSLPRRRAAIAARKAAEAKRQGAARQKHEAKRKHDVAVRARHARRLAKRRAEAARKAAQAAARARVHRVQEERAAARYRFQPRRSMGLRASPMTVRRPMNMRMNTRRNLRRR